MLSSVCAGSDGSEDSLEDGSACPLSLSEAVSSVVTSDDGEGEGSGASERPVEQAVNTKVKTSTKAKIRIVLLTENTPS